MKKQPKKKTDIQPVNSEKKKRGKGRPFPPGISGNPAGRPKKEVCITSWIKEELGEEALGKDGKPAGKNPDGQPFCYAQAIGRTLVRKAASGDMKASEIVLERTDGKVPLPLQNPDGTGLFEKASHEELEGLLAAATASRDRKED